MSDFLTNFLANLAADSLLAVALYFIITQPGERKKAQAAVSQALGLIKAEALINVSRSTTIIEGLDKFILHYRQAGYVGNFDWQVSITTLFPLRYTRGAWNALREGGFLPAINNPHLTYLLFRMNELIVVANNNLRKFELAVLEESEADKGLLAKTAKRDSERVYEALRRVLTALENQSVRAPDVTIPVEADESPSQDEEPALDD